MAYSVIARFGWSETDDDTGALVQYADSFEADLREFLAQHGAWNVGVEFGEDPAIIAPSLPPGVLS